MPINAHGLSKPVSKTNVVDESGQHSEKRSSKISLAARQDLQTTEQGSQQGLLGMQTILGLIEDAAGGPFHHTCTDLFAAVGRKAVENDRP